MPDLDKSLFKEAGSVRSIDRSEINNSASVPLRQGYALAFTDHSLLTHCLRAHLILWSGRLLTYGFVFRLFPSPNRLPEARHLPSSTQIPRKGIKAECAKHDCCIERVIRDAYFVCDSLRDYPVDIHARCFGRESSTQKRYPGARAFIISMRKSYISSLIGEY